MGGGSKVCAACDEHELSGLPFCIRVGVETLNSHVFPVLKDGHQLNGRGCNIHYNKDSLLNNRIQWKYPFFFFVANVNEKHLATFSTLQLDLPVQVPATMPGTVIDNIYNIYIYRIEYTNIYIIYIYILQKYGT